MWGLNVYLACAIHDSDYEVGRTLQDKRDADCRLLINLFIMIENAEQPHLEALRKNRAEAYYEAVSMGGKKAFMRGKEHEPVQRSQTQNT